MGQSLPDFQLLWDNYPEGKADDVKKGIGGHVDAPEMTNTCTIRLSRAFNAAGDPIPGPTAAQTYGMHVVSGNDKKWYAFRVKEFHKYLTMKYGDPLSFVMKDKRVPSGIYLKKGIIEFVVQFSDATGHFDVWDGKRTKYEQFFDKATRINFWPLPSNDSSAAAPAAAP